MYTNFQFCGCNIQNFSNEKHNHVHSIHAILQRKYTKYIFKVYNFSKKVTIMYIQHT